MESVLRTVAQLTQNCSERFNDEVWAQSLKFLLNVTDMVLSGQATPGTFKNSYFIVEIGDIVMT